MKIKILFIFLGIQGLIYGASVRQSSKTPNEEMGEYEELPSALGKGMPMKEGLAAFEGEYENDAEEDEANEAAVE